MQDFAYLKKYKPILNFTLEFIYNLLISFAGFFMLLFIFGLDSDSVNISTFDWVLSLTFSGIIFILQLSIIIQGLIRKLNFNKNNSDRCAIKLDTINNKLYLTNKKTEIFLKDIVDFDYIKVREGEFFEGHFFLADKNTSKSRIGNLRLKLKNEEVIEVERISDIENVNKKLKSILGEKPKAIIANQIH